MAAAMKVVLVEGMMLVAVGLAGRSTWEMMGTLLLILGDGFRELRRSVERSLDFEVLVPGSEGDVWR